MDAAVGRRRFIVSASYLRGRIERSVEIEADSPKQAAIQAIWKGLLPQEYTRGARPEPVFCNPTNAWPAVIDVAVTEDTATIAFAWGIQDGPFSLMVKVRPSAGN